MVRRRRNQVAAFSLFSFQDIISCVMGIMILVTLILALEVIDGGEIKHVSDVKERLAANRALIADLQREIARMQMSLDQVVTNTGLLAGIDSEQLQQDIVEGLQKKDQLTKRLAEQEVHLSKLSVEIVNANREIAASSVEKDRQNELGRKRVNEQRERLKSIINSEIVVFRDPPKRQIFLVEVTRGGYLVAKYGAIEPPTRCTTQQELGDFLDQKVSLDPVLYFIVKPSGITHYEEVVPYMQRRKTDFGFTVFGESAKVIDDVKGHIH